MQHKQWIREQEASHQQATSKLQAQLDTHTEASAQALAEHEGRHKATADGHAAEVSSLQAAHEDELTAAQQSLQTYEQMVDSHALVLEGVHTRHKEAHEENDILIAELKGKLKDEAASHGATKATLDATAAKLEQANRDVLRMRTEMDANMKLMASNSCEKDSASTEVKLMSDQVFHPTPLRPLNKGSTQRV